MEDKKIGCGSFGTVKLARHLSTCRMYAMKIVNDDDDGLDKLQRLAL